MTPTCSKCSSDSDLRCNRPATNGNINLDGNVADAKVINDHTKRWCRKEDDNKNGMFDHGSVNRCRTVVHRSFRRQHSRPSRAIVARLNVEGSGTASVPPIVIWIKQLTSNPFTAMS
jgi:hypothetical protein